IGSEMDQSKKTMRHFYCRDVLWETFEQMANDFDCSIDYLVNEAMRAYARGKNYALPSSSTASQPVPSQVVNQALAAGPSGPARSAPRSGGSPTASAASTLRPSGPPPPPPNTTQPMSRPTPPSMPTPSAGVRPITRPTSGSSPGPRATPEPAPAGPTLYLMF